MKRTLSIILTLVMLVCSSAWAADVKVSALPATTTLTDDDLFLTSTYLTGVYTSKKITVTSLKTIFQPSLSLLKGTLTNGYICTYTAAGTLLDCNTNPATFQTADTELTALAGLTSAANAIPYFTGSGTAGVISSSVDMVYLLGSADYATALTALGGQPVNDDLTTLSSGGTANCLWGEKSDSSGIECKTTLNLQLDDSAAQFYDATTTTNTVKIDAPTDTDGSIDAILDFSAVADADKTFSFPNASGTVALVKNEKLAAFSWDGGASAVSTANSKRCVAIPYAATIVGWTMVISGDPGAGGTILNITKDAYSDSALPTTEIDASDPPTVADDKVAATDAAPTGWTTAVTANDIICADVATNAVATWISLSIYGTK